MVSALHKRQYSRTKVAYYGQATSLEPKNNKSTLSSDDDDSDMDITKLNLTKFNNTTNLFRRLTNLSDATLHSNEPDSGQPPKLTFDTYVKKLTGTYTQNQSPKPIQKMASSALCNALNNTASNLTKQATTPTRLSLKITPAPSTTSLNKDKSISSLPTINPAIKAAMAKLTTTDNQYTLLAKSPQLTVNKILNNNGVGIQMGQFVNKLVTVNQPTSLQNGIKTVQKATVTSNIPSGLNKKIFIVNNNQSVASKSLIQNGGMKLINVQGPNLIKQTGTTQFSIKSNGGVTASSIVGLNKPIIMMNNSSIASNQTSLSRHF